MALQAEEEETIERLKAWWKENGQRLVTIVVVVVAGYSSWIFWQNSQTATVSAASDLYEQVLSLAVTDGQTEVGAEDRQTIIDLSEQLRSEYADTDYARFAAMYAAQQYVAMDELASAEASLRWILDNPRSGLFSQPDEALELTASLRLGRVLLAQGEAEAALQLVNSVDPQSFEASYAELRGDIYVAMDRVVDAREAYTAAQQAGSTSSWLQMKMNSLADES